MVLCRPSEPCAESPTLQGPGGSQVPPCSVNLMVLMVSQSCSLPAEVPAQGQTGCHFTPLLLSQPLQQEKSKYPHYCTY